MRTKRRRTALPRIVTSRICIRTARFFFFNDTATTEIYTLSLHDALPIYRARGRRHAGDAALNTLRGLHEPLPGIPGGRRAQLRLGLSRSGEHTSELQSQSNLGCRLLLEKKKELAHR